MHLPTLAFVLRRTYFQKIHTNEYGICSECSRHGVALITKKCLVHFSSTCNYGIPFCIAHVVNTRFLVPFLRICTFSIFSVEMFGKYDNFGPTPTVVSYGSQRTVVSLYGTESPHMII